MVQLAARQILILKVPRSIRGGASNKEGIMFLKEVWSEGCPKRDYTAGHMGDARGETLREVCDDLAARKVWFARKYNPLSMKYDGMKLFISEEEARRSFG
jgi:hypothetical protein